MKATRELEPHGVVGIKVIITSPESSPNNHNWLDKHYNQDKQYGLITMKSFIRLSSDQQRYLGKNFKLIDKVNKNGLLLFIILPK